MIQALDWNAETFSSWAACHFAKTPEKKLLVAIIQRAILDYLGRPEKWRASERGVINRQRLAAFEFLFSPSPDPWSMRWICEYLSEDGYALQNKILEGVQKLNTPEFSGLRRHCVHYRNITLEGYGRKRRKK